MYLQYADEVRNNFGMFKFIIWSGLDYNYG